MKPLFLGLVWLLMGSGLASAQPPTGGFFGPAEYLLWWFKSGQVPPLVTIGGDGVIGSPGTRVALDDLGFVDGAGGEARVGAPQPGPCLDRDRSRSDARRRPGGRFTLGYRFASDPRFALEARYFFLADGRDTVTFASSGDQVIGQPYIDAGTGAPAVTLVSPGLLRHVPGDDHRRLPLPDARGRRGERPAAQLRRERGCPDEFRMINNFYGGQVGLRAGARYGLLAVDVRGGLAIGQMQQIARKFPGPLAGVARPAFGFRTTDFWAQGLGFGLRLER